MKKFSAFVLTLFSTSSLSSLAQMCPTPSGYTAQAFKTIKNPALGSLEKYMETHLVAKDVSDSNCDTLYMASIRFKNEPARKFLEDFGFAKLTRHFRLKAT